MRSRLRFRLLVGAALLGAVAACVVDPLNPQPLPPGPDNEFSPDASFGHPSDGGVIVSGDAGALSDLDSAAPPNSPDGSDDAAADAGDAGDAGDADAD